MREIKFKVFALRDNEMRPVQSMRINEGGSITVNSGKFDEWIPVIVTGEHKDGELLQFIGLKDRNGNEIYDRTILRFFIDGKVFNEELYEVLYSEERACWQINCIKRCNHMDSPMYIASHLTQTLAECFEIAGNIFENPELKE